MPRRPGMAGSGFGKKARSEAAIHYIAEILGQFDLIGIVELRDKLADLDKVLHILGPYWRAVYSDMIPDPGGNRERIAYVYDKRAVTFTGFAATATPPRTKKGTEYLPDRSGWRPPYAASFQAGNFDFVVIAAHVRWGDSRKARLSELELFAEWVTAKRKEPAAVDKDILVMGDFNVEDEEMFKVLTSYGLKLPEALVGRDLGSNLERNKRYDQILHFPQYPSNFTNAGDVLDFYTGGIVPYRDVPMPRAQGCARAAAAVPGPEGKGQARLHVPAVRPLAAVGADQHRHRQLRAGADQQRVSGRGEVGGLVSATQ
jgi:hypothetical protein